MKIVICSVPIRKSPTTAPPLGVTRIMDALIDAGFSKVFFYNLDLLRHSEENIIDYISLEKPDWIGISEIVTTYYSYVK